MIAVRIQILSILVFPASLALAQSEAPSPDELANCSYQGIYDHAVQLENGSFEGEPFVPGVASRPRVRLVRDFRLTGDLDGDGHEEAIVLLTESSGGTGTDNYLAAVGRRGGSIVNLGTALLGDRVQVVDARVFEGKKVRVELDVVQAGPEDPMCCPSQKARRSWSLTASGLVEGKTAITGTFSLKDLEGVEWVLTHLARDEPAPAEPKVTLNVEGNRVNGAGGCNRYFAELQSTAAGEVEVGAIGSTRMACPGSAMELEGRYLEALDGALKYGFIASKLALTTKVGEVYETLLFDADRADDPVYTLDFSDYEDPNGSIHDWLEGKGFKFKRDTKNEKKVELSFRDDKLHLRTRVPAFGLIVHEQVIPGVSRIRIHWGVAEFPEGASYEHKIDNEALMVYVFFGHEKFPSGSVFIPKSPYFIGLYLCDTDRVERPYRGHFYKQIGRFVCLGQPSPGETITSEFNLGDAFKNYFEKHQVPAVSGLGLEVDTKQAHHHGRAAAFIKRIELLE